MVATHIWFIGKRWRVNRQEQHVVTALHQLGGHRIVAEAAPAIHPACAAREIKNSHLKSSNGDRLLECTTCVKMFKEIAFVRLVPTDLIGRQCANVETIDMR